MTIYELKNYYKSSYAFAQATKMSHSSYQNWCEWGFIPIMSQMRIELLTLGKLKADLKHGRKE